MKFTPLSARVLFAAALSASLAACGGGGGSGNDLSTTTPVIASVDSVTQSGSGANQVFTVSGSSSSQPNALASMGWTATALTSGAPALTLTNADCSVAVKKTVTVNTTNKSVWACGTVATTPSGLTGPATYRIAVASADSASNAATAYTDITMTGGTVTLFPAPTATTPATLSAISGQSVAVNCAATGGVTTTQTPYSFTWVTLSNPAGLAISTTNSTPSILTFNAPTVTTPASVTFQCRVTDANLQVGVSSTVVTINPAATAASVANAGGTQTVSQNALVTLSGAASTSAVTGAPLTYTWTQLTGPTVTLNGTNTSTATFTAPPVSAPATLTFKLVVQTAFEAGQAPQASETDTAVVYVNPDQPLTLVMPGSSVVQKNTAASLTVAATPDTGTLYYSWTQVEGPTVTLGGANTQTASFVAPNVTVATELRFTVSVSRYPLATASASEIFSSDVVLSVSP
jgi:hypothetical protein